MTDRDLDAWLRRLEGLHPSEIDLGLQRSAEVWARTGFGKPAPLVISIAGTNGKGSSVAFLEQLLAASGQSVLAYTSPHIICFNERIRINAEHASDSQICSAFEAIDEVRGEIPLTYFEFATLAAFYLASISQVDVAILEVGLGGRLDAVNIIDADAALITSIGIDHAEWLGDNRESIGFEKAGIFRPDQVAVSADPKTPESVSSHAKKLNSRYFERNLDFYVDVSEEGSWQLTDRAGWAISLPGAGLAGDHQINNLAGCIMLLKQLGLLKTLPFRLVENAVRDLSLEGRCQVVSERPLVLLDVAHNPDSAKMLAEVAAKNDRETIAVFAALADKDLTGILEPLVPIVGQWHIAELEVPRSAELSQLANAFDELDVSQVTTHPNVKAALQSARQNADDSDQIVVFGSFYTVSEVWDLFPRL